MRLRVAASIAALVALVLGCSTAHWGPADAADSRVAVTALRIRDQVVSRKGSNFFTLGLKFRTASGYRIDSVDTRVSIGGKKVGVATGIVPSAVSYSFDSSWGVGTVRLGPTTIHFHDSSGTKYTVTDRRVSNSAQARMHTTGTFSVTTKRGQDTFSLYAVNFDKTKFVSARSAQIQYKDKKTWKYFATVRLGSDGKGSHKAKVANRHTWRMLVPRTPTVEGATATVTA